MPGYLYVVAEEVGAGDARPHPHPVNVSKWEWLTNRELAVELVEETLVQDSERLTEDQVAEMRRKQEERGELSFAEWSG